jgi:hypothetical protein
MEAHGNGTTMILLTSDEHGVMLYDTKNPVLVN